jgi:iron complex transport system substrate-binding protein
MSALFIQRLTVLAMLAVVACDRPTPRAIAAVTDDFGDTLRIGAAPSRIVSLNPTTTEMLFSMGAGPRLVGRTHWDLYPDSARLVPDLGTGIRPNVEAVLGSRPDLVVLYASADNRAAALQLRKAGVNTVSLKIDLIRDFERASRILGLVLRDSARAATVSDSVLRTLDRVRQSTRDLPRPTVFWHIWDAPLITIGKGSYMNELIDIAGGRNVYGDIDAPSPPVSIEDVLRRDPQYIITGPEGARKIRADKRWAAAPAVRAGRVLVVDTAVVGRPAVRLGEAAVALAKALHPDVVRR